MHLYKWEVWWKYLMICGLFVFIVWLKIFLLLFSFHSPAKAIYMKQNSLEMVELLLLPDSSYLGISFEECISLTFCHIGWTDFNIHQGNSHRYAAMVATINFPHFVAVFSAFWPAWLPPEASFIKFFTRSTSRFPTPWI